MSPGILLPLLNNAALLLAAAVIYGAAGFRPRRRRTLVSDLGAGVALGILGVLVMLNGWVFRPGIVMDMRSVVLGLSGLFFGALPAGVAVVMTAINRLWLGGPGAAMGVAVIVSAAAVGVGWRAYSRHRMEELSLWEYYLFGVVVHVVMLGCSVFLPQEVRGRVLSTLGGPILVIYPVVTALLAWVMMSWSQRARTRETARELAEAREHLNALLEAAPLAIIGLDLEGRVTAWNAGAEQIFQWRRDEVLGRRTPIVPDGQWEEYSDLAEGTLAGAPLRGLELVRQRKDGSRVRVRVHNAALRGSDGAQVGFVGIVEDLTEADRATRRLRAQEERQVAAAGLGQRALEGEEIDVLFRRAAEVLAGMVDAPYAGVLELAGPGTLRLAAGVGWDENVDVRVDVRPDSPLGRVLEAEDAVGAEEMASDDRPDRTPLLADYGIRSGITVRLGDRERPFGVLGVYDRELRTFEREDVEFVRSVAHLLALEIERQEAERARREAYERLLKAQRVGNVGFLDWDLRSDEIEWSAETYRMFGVSPEEGTQTIESTVALCHPDDRDRVERALGEAIQGERSYHIVHRMVRPDGGTLWVRAQGELERDEEGTPIRLLGTVVDVTELMRMQEELRGSEERYRRLFRHALSADYISTPDGRLIDCNPTFVHLFGFESREAALNTPIADLYPDPSDRQAFLDRLREEGSVEATEGSYLRTDGTILRVIESAVAVRDERDDVVEIIGFIVDVSERTALESQLRQAQKMEALGRLAGGVAHDFNNNLAVILGHAELARSDLPPEHPLQTELTIIEQAGERSADLTRQLLAFSRRQAVEPAVLDLNDVVSGSSTMLQRLVGEDIRWEFRPAAELWKVRIDPAQIEQILVNLVLNARDAIQGTGTIVVETANVSVDEVAADARDEAAPGEYSVLTVRDTGHGMDEGTQERIFEPFFTTKAEGLGTGLGLSTLYGIVKQNGGWVDVDSEPGAGSTFRVFLRRFEGAAPGRVAKDRFGAVTGSETVLVAEDEPALLALVGKILERHGYTVLAAPTPREAIDRAREYPGEIHLLLTDVVMPGMNGPQLKERVEALRPGIKTLFASGYTDDVVFESGVLDGEDDFIQKPFAVQRLAKKVRQVLDA